MSKSDFVADQLVARLNGITRGRCDHLRRAVGTDFVEIYLWCEGGGNEKEERALAELDEWIRDTVPANIKVRYTIVNFTEEEEEED